MVEVKRCVAILSGGVDSFSYALQWRARGYTIYPILFLYGQKGAKEVEVAKRLSLRAGFAEPVTLDISALREVWQGTQLTDSRVEVEAEYRPTVVVPIRNIVFLSIASAYALSIGASVIIYGAHLSDVAPRADTGEPMYPDCTPDAAKAFEEVVRVAHFPVGRPKLEVWSPAREGLSKAENLRRGYAIAGDLIFETWSCYLSGERHCGRCESCVNRHRAFVDAGIPDRTSYSSHPMASSICRAGGCGVK